MVRESYLTLPPCYYHYARRLLSHPQCASLTPLFWVYTLHSQLVQRGGHGLWSVCFHTQVSSWFKCDLYAGFFFPRIIDCRTSYVFLSLHRHVLYTTLHSLHYTTLHYTTLHYTTLHYTTLHYTTLHYITLHYTTLHYTTLHYTHYYTVLHP